MHRRAPLQVVLLVAAASCATRSASPPALAYRLPDPAEATYDVGDTITVEVSALGQRLSLGVDMTAAYALGFERGDADGVRVTLGVDDLAARVRAPLAEPIQLDESIVTGNLVFLLGRRGDVTVISMPELAATGGQLLSPIGVAHSLFPRLPGTAVAAGDGWVDTLSYDDAASGASAHSILEYTVAGDTVVDGLSLLAIDFTGTSETSQKTTLQGADISQSSEVEVQGRFLWDAGRGLLFQREATTSGTGQVTVAAVPAPLPTTIESHSVARLRVE
jgi:hypothetical protein